LDVLAGDATEPPPIWIMRQAGRYLPEYLKTRKEAGSFLELCMTPELAADVTLQPIRRFDFDAAIIFSDILVVPYALGQDVTYEEGQGPILGPLPDLRTASVAENDQKLAPVYEAICRVRQALVPEKALIGFCGAPWTVVTYMVAGRGTSDQAPARKLALEDPDRLQALIDVLIDASARHFVKQAQAGADVLKIFDTWAGVLDDEGFERWCIRPTRQIVQRIRDAGVKAPVIGFPRGAGARLGLYASSAGVDAVAVDWMTPMTLARELVPAPIALQGNLDPLRLVAGGDTLDRGVDAILEAMRGRAHVFNLGHGITPDTPIRNVERMIERVRRNAS
jgi:uroporphyrinogen decarboxylase